MAIAEVPSTQSRLARLTEVFFVFLAAAMFASVTGLMVYLTPGIDESTFGWFVGTYVFAYGSIGCVATVYVLAFENRAYLDLSVPSLFDVRDVLVAYLVVVVGVLAVTAVAAFAGLPVLHAGSIGNPVRPPLLLAAVPLSLFVGVPAQELLFRNACQKRLDERFPTWVAVGVSSLLMVLLTLGTFVGAPPLGLVVPALAVAIASTAIGVVYVRSGSLVSAWLLHAALTVTLLSLLYLDATTALDLASLA